MRLFLLIFSLSLTLSASKNTCTQYKGKCQSDWMWNLPAEVAQLPINSLILPATHDSAAYQVDFDASTSMEKTSGLNTAAWFANSWWSGWIVKPFIEKLTLAQGLSIFQQLEQGNRAFDFRLMYNPDRQMLYLSHSFATIPFTTALNDIKTFMAAHPAEVIVISLQDDSEHAGQTQAHNAEALELVKTYFNDMIVPSNKITSDMTLQNLVEHNKRLFVTFEDVFQPNLIQNFWPNKQQTHDSLSHIQSNILPNLTKASDNFNLVFFTVTPDEKTMIVNLLSNITSSNNPTSLREWAAEINPLATQLVALNLCHLSGLNMISEDWPRDEDIQHIIAWNHTVPTKRPCYHP